MTVFLVPAGHGRFELYSEPPEDLDEAAAAASSRWRQWAVRARVQWQSLVDMARSGTATGRMARWRDRVVCRLAETIAEQRTLWALSGKTAATLLFPSSVQPAQARSALDQALAAAQRHHGIWLGIDTPLLIVSAILAPVPGPNAVAYYLAFRVVGHYLAWRGARYAIKNVAWTLQPDSNLAELATLIDVPRAARKARVIAIARRLNLQRLSAFFERVAA